MLSNSEVYSSCSVAAVSFRRCLSVYLWNVSKQLMMSWVLVRKAAWSGIQCAWQPTGFYGDVGFCCWNMLTSELYMPVGRSVHFDFMNEWVTICLHFYLVVFSLYIFQIHRRLVKIFIVVVFTWMVGCWLSNLLWYIALSHHNYFELLQCG